MSKQINEQKMNEFITNFLGSYDWQVSIGENNVTTYHKKLNVGHNYETIDSFYTVMLALLECAFKDVYPTEIKTIREYLNK